MAESWQHSRDIDAPLRGAINYTLKIWDKLRIYTTNGMLSIDNNAVERALRTVAIDSKITCSVVHMKERAEAPCCTA